MERKDVLRPEAARGLRAELRSDWKTVAALAGFAAAVQGVLWIGWPLHMIRTIGIGTITYFVNAFERAQPTAYNALAYNEPLPPLLHGLSLSISPFADGLAQTLLAILSVVMVYLIAKPWGWKTAIVAAIAYQCDLPLQLIYHQVNSEALASWFYLLTLLMFRYALQQMTVKRWMLVGGAVGLAALSRPAMLAFIILVGCVLINRASLKRSLAVMAAAMGVTVAVLAPWVIYKGARFDVWGFTRPSVDLLFYAARYYGVVDTHNGPASRNLAQLLDEKILARPEYAGQGISADDLLLVRLPPGREDDPYASTAYVGDVVTVVDEVEGWNTNYRLLNQVALEGIAAHPQQFIEKYAADAWVVITSYDEILIPKPRKMSIFVRGPGQQPPIYRVANSHPNSVPDPSTKELETMAVRVRAILGPVAQAQGNEGLAQVIINVWQSIWPPMLLLYGLTLIAVAGSKGRGLTFWLVSGGVTTVLITYSVMAGALPRYRMPFEPFFIMGAVIGASALAGAVYRLAARQSPGNPGGGRISEE